MKPAPFSYADPRSLPEALSMLAEHGADGKVLAGGQSLVPLLNMRLAQPAVVIDLNGIPELTYLRSADRDGGPGIAIGAMTRQRAVEKGDGASMQLPLLAEAIGWVGHPQIRNRGTVGGSIAHADPAAELPVAFRALDGVATVVSERGRRKIPASKFFEYTFTPAVGTDELLVEVWFPLPAPRTGQAFIEVARRHGDFALVAAAVAITLNADGTVAEARIALGGAAPVPARADRAETSLRGEHLTEELFAEAARLAAAEMDPTSDVHADADYRRDVARTLVRRGLQAACARARGDRDSGQ